MSKKQTNCRVVRKGIGLRRGEGEGTGEDRRGEGDGVREGGYFLASWLLNCATI